MTTTMTKTDPATDRPQSHRIPSVAANLLPVEVMEARRTRRIQRTVVALLAVFVLLLGGWYGFAHLQTSNANDALDNTRADYQGLNTRLGAFSELQKVRSDSAAIDNQLAVLLANDMAWPTLLADLRQAAPANLTLTGITVTLDAGRTTGRAATDGPVAFVAITGLGTSKPQIASYVDALARITGVADPFITNVTAGEKGLDFNVKVNVTSALLGGRFAKSKAAK